MEIVLKSNVNRDKYTDYIQEHFDLAVSDVAEVRIPNNLSKLNKKQKLRASYCHEYVGEGLCGYEELIKPIEQMRYDKSMEGQLTLF